jgi:hypothetical protein
MLVITYFVHEIVPAKTGTILTVGNLLSVCNLITKQH